MASEHPPYNWTDLVSESALNQSNTTVQEEHVVPCEQSIFFFVIYGPLYGLVCGFGLVGNSLSFAVLHKYSRDNVATYLLKALAVSDNIFLAYAAFVQMYPAMAMFFGLTEQLKPIYPYLQIYAWPMAHVVQMGTVWMTVLIGANRYIAVSMPLHASRLCSKKKVQIEITTMTVFIFIYNIPRFFEYQYVNVNVTDVNNNTVVEEQNVGLISSHIYNILYENVAYCLFVFLIPLLILIIFNVHLVKNLKKASDRRKVMKASISKSGGKSSAEENNITLVMIIIIIVFIVCQTPASINQILFYVLDESYKNNCGSYIKYYHLSNLLIIMNSSVNFIIYCLFRRQFQQELRALFCRGGKTPTISQPLRKTLILRHLHERPITSDSCTYSTYVRSPSNDADDVRTPLKANPDRGNSNNHHYQSNHMEL